ncbi:MAG: spinster family MFS transporter [Gemmatimonas sp.]|nr:MFS transporter [Gemmatimonadaceae bacterium]
MSNASLSVVVATHQIAVRIPGNEMSEANGTLGDGRRGAWGALAILTSINLLNYIDRFVFPAVSESIKHSTLHPTDTAIGLGSTAFLAVYLVTAPFFGAVGDRPQRTRWVAAGIALWSAATALGGLARTMPELIGARSLVGVGEAAYSAIAPAILADFFPEKTRGRAFAIFFAATPVGAALGYGIGGFVDAHWGWREAFFAAGAPGLLLAWLMLRMRAPDRIARSVGEPPRALRVYRRIAENPQYRLTVLGYAAYTFAVGGIAAWMPVFVQRTHGVSSAVANNQLAVMLVVTGLVGALGGGWIGDRMLRRNREAYLWLSGVTTLLAAPLAWIALTTADTTVYLVTLFAAELLIFTCTAPINSKLISLVPPGMRAAAMALCICTIHVLGDVPSPTLIGWISDRSSIQQGVLVIPAAVVVSGAIWMLAALRGARLSTTEAVEA